jgi:hypothetical protein
LIGACLKNINLPQDGSVFRHSSYFPLKYTKYSCGKMPRLAKNALALGHIAIFQAAPNVIDRIGYFLKQVQWRNLAFFRLSSLASTPLLRYNTR